MTHTSRKPGYLPRYLRSQVRGQGSVLLLLGVFLLGFLLGCRGAAVPQLAEFAGQLAGAGSTGTPLFSRFLALAVLDGALLLGMFLLGFCAISPPFVLGVLLFRGLGFGLVGGALYAGGERTQILYYLLVLLPQVLCSGLLLVLGGRTALRFSRPFFDLLTGREGEDFPQVGEYCLRFFLLLGLCALCSAGCAVIQLVFDGLLPLPS